MHRSCVYFFRAMGICIISHILTGCVMHSPSSDKCSKTVKEMWVQVDPSEFTIPNATPYDEDSHLRDEYIEGYNDGISQGIDAFRKGEWHTGDVFFVSEKAEAYAKGWRDAGIVILEKNGKLLA